MSIHDHEASFRGRAFVWGGLALGVLLLAALLSRGFGLLSGGARGAESPDLMVRKGDLIIVPEGSALRERLTVMPAVAQAVSAKLLLPAVVESDPARTAAVLPALSGRLIALKVGLGDRVARGQVLAVIDSPDLGQAKSDVDKAQADLTAADHELSRQKDLFEAQAGAKRDLEQAQDNEEKAKAELERARQRLKLLHGEEGNGERYVLRAPISGEVFARNLNPGIEVQGQYGGGTAVELFTVGAIDSVWIWADLFEMDLAAFQKGAALSATVPAYPKREFTGRVDWISPALDPVTRTARVRCVLANPHGELKPEMYATVHISTGERRALAIPRSAVLRIGEQTLVFVQEGRTESGLFRFQRRAVHVDENAAGDLLPVIDGLQRGDVVVITGGLQLTSMT